MLTPDLDLNQGFGGERLPSPFSVLSHLLHWSLSIQRQVSSNKTSQPHRTEWALPSLPLVVSRMHTGHHRQQALDFLHQFLKRSLDFSVQKNLGHRHHFSGMKSDLTSPKSYPSPASPCTREGTGFRVRQRRVSRSPALPLLLQLIPS